MADAIQALALVNRMYARIDARRPTFRDREDYYQGKHPLHFATEEWQKSNAARYAGFSDNWCRPVVDAEAERVQVQGIKLGEADEGGKGAALLHEQWLLNEMEAQSSQGFLTSLTTSTSFVLVWGDSDDDSVITWEHPSSFEIEYDWANRRKRVAALKTWADDKLEFATLYTATDVWKFQRPRASTPDEKTSQAVQAREEHSTTGGWLPREVRNETWPIPNPMGEVPAVEIPNRPILAGDPVSEIEGVMAMQDAINLLWAYMFLAADYASMPARVITGAEPPKIPILDTAGKVIGHRDVEVKDIGEKRFMFINGQNVGIDHWPAATLDPFIAAIRFAVGHIAMQTRTPATYMAIDTGLSNVAEGGLKASEVPLNTKVREFQTFANPGLREMFRLVALAKGDTALAALTRRSSIGWVNPEIRSESQMADALLKKKQVGYPLEYLLEMDGMDQPTIDRVIRMREQEMTDPMIAGALREFTEVPGGGSADGAGAVQGSAAGSGGDGGGF